MFTVGLLSKERIKTYNYDSLELAKKEFKEWRNAFLNNNSVESYTTIIERDGCNTVKSIKLIFKLGHSRDLSYMFLSENEN